MNFCKMTIEPPGPIIMICQSETIIFYDTLFCRCRGLFYPFTSHCKQTVQYVLLKTNFLSQTDILYWLFFIQKNFTVQAGSHTEHHWRCFPPSSIELSAKYLSVFGRITYWAPLEMLPPSSTELSKCKVLKCFWDSLKSIRYLKVSLKILPISSLKVQTS
jgi:hypothetical protein